MDTVGCRLLSVAGSSNDGWVVRACCLCVIPTAMPPMTINRVNKTASHIRRRRSLDLDRLIDLFKRIHRLSPSSRSHRRLVAHKQRDTESCAHTMPRHAPRGAAGAALGGRSLVLLAALLLLFVANATAGT